MCEEDTGKDGRKEQFHISGDELLAKVKELVHEATVRRIIIKNAQGGTILVIPLAVGVVGTLIRPVWAAIGALAALLTDCVIEVERAGD